MRVHVVTTANRHQYLDEIEAMHRLRYRLFVDLMGWKALESPDRLDIDEFDNANATYLILLDDDGVVRGSARFTPTWRPNMLKNLFPEYVDGEPPVGPAIWEWTRHCPGDPAWPKDLNLQIRTVLHIAVHEFAASRLIENYTGIVDTRIVARMVDLGWRVDPIGLPVNYGEGTAFAFMAPVSAANAEQLRKRIGRHDTILVEMPRGLTAESRKAIDLAIGLPNHQLEKAETTLRQIAGADR